MLFIIFLCIVACTTSCLQCTGPSGNQCTQCNTPTYLFNGSCYNPCPNATYESVVGVNRLCIGCDVTCLTCNGGYPNNCLSCAFGSDLINGQCVGSCPYQGTYYNFSNFILIIKHLNHT